ncbi:MAG TPA: hypothetical protein VFY89_10325 [Ktedonobacterales bacterium]
MPTHDELPEFLREFYALSPARQRIFAKAVAKMVEDMRARKPLRSSLRVSVLGGHPNIYEMTWDMPNGRATFMFGAERIPGEPHIIWRRIGGHEIFSNP